MSPRKRPKLKTPDSTSNQADIRVTQRTPVAMVPHYPGPEITRKALDLEGWHINHLPDRMRRCRVSISRRIPSPFASQEDQTDEMEEAINTHVHDGFRLLFNQVRAHWEYTARAMLDGHAISDDGCNGRLCALGNSNHRQKPVMVPEDVPPAVKGWPTRAESKLEIAIDKLFSASALALPGQAIKQNVDAGKSLEIRRLVNPHDGRTDYFVVNTDLELLAINESAVGAGLVAGPLPDFAIITIGPAALFWWRTHAAWSYIPTLRQGIQNPRITPMVGNIGHEQDRRALGLTWEEILQQGLERHRNEWRESPNANVVSVESTAAMFDEEVWMAIGSIWEALRNKQPSVVNGYAGLDVFSPLEERIDTEHAAGKGKRFIMPVIFPADNVTDHSDEDANKSKGKAIEETKTEYIGHFVLAVACLDVRNGERIVRMEIYDSDTEQISKAEIRQRTREIIEISQWAGRDKRRYANNRYVTTPQQEMGSNACGLYTILNAWMVMLEIPIQQSVTRRGWGSHEDFVTQGKEIINLALAGHLDSRTIQAFVNVFGLADQDSNSDSPVYPVSAVRMNNQRLNRRLIRQRCLDNNVPVLDTPSPN